jgi:hypothetical protein
LNILEKGEVSMFWVAEPFPKTQNYHLHALINLPTGKHKKDIIEKGWFNVSKPIGKGKHNQFDAVEYEPSKGARFYISKAILNPKSEYDFAQLKGLNE